MKKQIIIVLLCLACGLLSCTRTDSCATTKELTQNELAEAIYNVSRSGLRGNSETLMKYVEMFDSHNVGPTVNTYMNTYNESMFGALMRNRFISKETRANAVRHIKNMFTEQARRMGVYIDDIDERMEGHIDFEKNKFGRMNSKDLDKELKIQTDRFNQTLQKENTIFPANGKIDDDYRQGCYIGDCWLIATIKSLSINLKGSEILSDMMSIDEKGNVTVQLKGVDRKYTISKEELEGANELAQGDLDVRAIEIAVYNYYHEIVDHTTFFKRIKKFGDGSPISPDNNSAHGSGMNNLCTPYCILIGKEFCMDEKPNNETIEKIQSGKYSTIVSSWNKGDMDGFFKHHAYAVIGADDNYVYLSDPYNPNNELKMEHSVFLNFFDHSYSTKP